MNQLFELSQHKAIVNEKIPISSPPGTDPNHLSKAKQQPQLTHQRTAAAAPSGNISPSVGANRKASSSTVLNSHVEPSTSSPSATSPYSTAAFSSSFSTSSSQPPAPAPLSTLSPSCTPSVSRSASAASFLFNQPSTSTAEEAHCRYLPTSIEQPSTSSAAEDAESSATTAESTSRPSTSNALQPFEQQPPPQRPVRISFSLDAFVAQRLRRIARGSPRVLRKLGIATVFLRGNTNSETPNGPTGKSRLGRIEAESVSIRIPQEKSPSPPPPPAKPLSQRQRPQSVTKTAASTSQQPALRMERASSRTGIAVAADGRVLEGESPLSFQPHPHGAPQTPTYAKPPGTPMQMNVQGRPPTASHVPYHDQQPVTATESPLLMNLLSSNSGQAPMPSQQMPAGMSMHMQAHAGQGGVPPPPRYAAQQVMPPNAANPAQMQHYMQKHYLQQQQQGGPRPMFLPGMPQQPGMPPGARPMMMTPTGQPMPAPIAAMEQNTSEPATKKRKRGPTKKQQKEMEAAMKQQQEAAALQQQKMQQQHQIMASQQEYFMMQQQQRVPPVNMHMPAHGGQMPPQYAARMGYPPQYAHAYSQQASAQMMGSGPQYPNPQGGFPPHQQQMWHQNMQQSQMASAQQQAEYQQFQQQQMQRGQAMMANQQQQHHAMGASTSAAQQQQQQFGGTGMGSDSPVMDVKMGGRMPQPPGYAEHSDAGGQPAAAFPPQSGTPVNYAQHQASGFMSPQSHHTPSPGAYPPAAPPQQHVQHAQQQPQHAQQQHAAFGHSATDFTSGDIDDLVASMGSGEAEDFDLDSIEPFPSHQPQQQHAAHQHGAQHPSQQQQQHQHQFHQQQAHHFAAQQQHMPPNYPQPSGAQQMMQQQVAHNGAYGSPCRTPQPQFQQHPPSFHHSAQQQMQQMVQSPAAQHTPPHQMQQQQQLRAPTPRQMEKMKREAEEREQQELASLLECPSPRDGDPPLSPARISEEREKSIYSTIDQVVEKVLGAARNGDAATTAAGPGKGGRGKGKGKKNAAAAAAANATPHAATPAHLTPNAQTPSSHDPSPVHTPVVKLEPAFNMPPSTTHALTHQSSSDSAHSFAQRSVDSAHSVELSHGHHGQFGQYEAEMRRNSLKEEDSGNGAEFNYFNGHPSLLERRIDRKASSSSDRGPNGAGHNHYGGGGAEHELFRQHSQPDTPTSRHAPAVALKTEVVSTASDTSTNPIQTTTGAPLIAPNTHTPPSATDDPRVQKAATQRRNRRKADLSQEASPRSDTDDPFLSSTAAGAAPQQLITAGGAVEQNLPASSG